MSIKVKDIPSSYQEAKKLLGKVNIRNVGSTYRYDRYDNRKEYQGYLIKNPDGLDIYLKLYDTVIVRYYPQGSMKLDCGHYPTVTTMRWINNALSGWKNSAYHSYGYISRDTIKDIDEYTYDRLIYNAPAIRGFAYGKVLPVIISPDGRVEKC